MRDVELPIGETVSFSFSPSFSDDFEQIDNGDGTVTLKGQSIGSDQFADLKKARENGGKVLYAVIYIEQQMDEIITRHFLGGSSHYYERLPLFEDSILHAVLGFHHKKEIVFKIAGEKDKIGKKQKGKLQKQLTDLMRWRNAFAHGKVMYDTKDGCFIEFHSGGKKQCILNDEFWGKIEIAYSESLETLKQLRS